MAAPANFTENAGGSNTIPIGRLSLSPNGGAYSALAAGANAVSSGDDPNTAGNGYQAVLVYTAATP